MGQNFSSANNVFVVFDQPVSLAGDVVSGLVVLNCVEQFDCTAIQLRVEGYETTFWDEISENRYQDSDGEWKEDKVTNPRSAKTDFFSVTVPCHTWQQYCQQGQYQFPFRFMLPEGLPATFHFRDNYSTQGVYTYQNLTADVEYKVTAECVRPGALTPNLRNSQPLVVRQRIHVPPSELRAESTNSISSCCCFGQGSVTIRLSVQKDTYVAGETAQLLLEVENQADVDFPKVELQLVRTVELTASSSYRKDDDNVVKLSLPGVGRGESFSGLSARALSIPLPHDLLATTRGKLINCSYSAVVKMHAGSFISEAKLKVPITVFAAAPPNMVLASQPPPAYWQPTVIGTPVELTLPSAPPLAPQTQTMSAGENPAYAGPAK